MAHLTRAWNRQAHSKTKNAMPHAMTEADALKVPREDQLVVPQKGQPRWPGYSEGKGQNSAQMWRERASRRPRQETTRRAKQEARAAKLAAKKEEEAAKKADSGVILNCNSSYNPSYNML